MTSHLRFALALVPALAAGAAAAQQQCQLQDVGTADVAATRDGRTLALADGSEVRLAAIETPDGREAEASRAALEALVAGNSLTLKRLARDDRDRYGRRLAFAFASNSPQSLQQALLEQGHAWVSARVGDAACAKILLTAEGVARAAHRGFWADPNFAPLRAERPAELAAEQGRFVLVEGTVLSVHESSGTIYLNFGQHWTEGFSVTIASRLRNTFTVAGLEPNTLQGRHIRVRGWVEYRAAPIIDAASPEQIELLY